MAISRFLTTTLAATFLLQAAAFVNAPSALLNVVGVSLSAVAVESLYRPPIRPRPSSRTNGTGSRGCENNSPPPILTPLVPDNHDGHTIAARPTFYWYLENASVAKFTLVEPGVTAPLLEKTVQVNKPGIMSITLPDDAPELAIDKDYRWTVSVVCEGSSRVLNVFTQSFVRRVALSSELSQELAGANTEIDRARIYARNGKWYDALAAYGRAVAQDPKLKDEMLAVMDEVKLNSVTNQERKNTQAVNTP